MILTAMNVNISLHTPIHKCNIGGGTDQIPTQHVSRVHCEEYSSSPPQSLTGDSSLLWDSGLGVELDSAQY